MLILDDGRFAQMNADRPMPAASSIKTPILLTALQRVDTGDLHWNEPLVLTKELVGGGAGWMASRPLGSRFPARVAATEMIRVSDNSATNLLIERVGGQQTINQRFRDLGLTATEINDWLPDLDGTNTTSAHDLSRSIALVDTGEALSLRSRDLFREIMATSVTNTLLPTGLLKGLGGAQGAPDPNLASQGYRVYNKTGDIGIAYADAGLIELPDGRRAVAGFLVKGPFNDPRSTNLIRAMAAAAPTSSQSRLHLERSPPSVIPRHEITASAGCHARWPLGGSGPICGRRHHPPATDHPLASGATGCRADGERQQPGADQGRRHPSLHLSQRRRCFHLRGPERPLRSVQPSRLCGDG